MRSKIGMALVGVLVLAVVVGIAWAQSAPQLINYQGRLADSSGMPPADGSTVDLTFSFYGVESGPTPLYLTVLQEDVVVTGGLYNVLIGSGTITPGDESSLAAVFQKYAEVWMGVKVDADAEMTPRARIGSVPYAMSVDIGSIFSLAAANPDYDNDGFRNTLIGGNDCNDNNNQVNPAAIEVCDDGIDNDCDGDIDGADSDCGSAPPSGMALIPSGCFDMGDHFNEGASHELPVHNVCISSFNMDVTEVTNAQYKACVDVGGCTAPSNSSSSTRSPYYGNPTYDDYPVIYVSWNQATAYCAWSGKRLPTEAEWEYAARGGLSGKRFPWGDTISCANANYTAYPSGYSYDTNPTDEACIGDTSLVGSYAPNGYGLYDMAGNVEEWVNDWYQSDYYSVSPINDPPGPASGTYRVSRSGAFDATGLLRVAARDFNSPADQYEYQGFRCAGD